MLCVCVDYTGREKVLSHEEITEKKKNTSKFKD